MCNAGRVPSMCLDRARRDPPIRPSYFRPVVLPWTWKWTAPPPPPPGLFFPADSPPVLRWRDGGRRTRWARSAARRAQAGQPPSPGPFSPGTPAPARARPGQRLEAVGPRRATRRSAWEAWRVRPSLAAWQPSFPEKLAGPRRARLLRPRPEGRSRPIGARHPPRGPAPWAWCPGAPASSSAGDSRGTAGCGLVVRGRHELGDEE